VEKKQGYKLTTAYNLRILAKPEACISKGEKGALLQKQGICHSTYEHKANNTKKGNNRYLIPGNVTEKSRKSICWAQRLPGWNRRTKT